MLGQTVSCAEAAAKYAKWARLATPAGGRSKSHQKEAAKAAAKWKIQVDTCQGVLIEADKQDTAATEIDPVDSTLVETGQLPAYDWGSYGTPIAPVAPAYAAPGQPYYEQFDSQAYGTQLISPEMQMVLDQQQAAGVVEPEISNGTNWLPWLIGAGVLVWFLWRRSK